LHYANQFDVCCFLDANSYDHNYAEYDFILAFGCKSELKPSEGNAFESLKIFYENHKEWLFGFFSYDLKNEIEILKSEHPDYINFPDLYFFIPEHLIASKNNKVEVILGDESILRQINGLTISEREDSNSLTIKSRFSREEYIKKVNILKDHIIRGDVYEVNFCQEFFTENA